MQIFDKHLFGSDADWFIKACRKEQKKWILKNTNQKSEVLIEEFLNSKMNLGKEECESCKKEKNANISEGISKTVATSEVDNSASGVGKRGANQRRKNS